MSLKVSAFLLVLHFVVVCGSFETQRDGDVIIGQLLPVHQISGDKNCTDPDLASIVKAEALVYAANQLTTESDGLKIGYDIIDTCSDATRENFAVKKWFEDEKNLSRIPIAIITDLPSTDSFYSLAGNVKSKNKGTCLISLKHQSRLWNNGYSMIPNENMPQRAVFGLVRHFNWNILDIVKYGDYADRIKYFRDLTEDSDVCLLNEISFKNSDLERSKRAKKNSPVAVLFSKDEEIPKFIEALPAHNLSDWDIVLGNEISAEKHYWAEDIAGVVGIRRNYGDLKGFEQHLEKSKLLENALMTTYCSSRTAEECKIHKDKVIKQNIHRGAPVIDAAYAIIKSREAGSNRLPNSGLTGIRVTSLTGRIVSFEPEYWTRNTIVYDVLNFHENKFVKVGKIEFAPDMKVTMSNLVVWKNESPQGKCSADCEKGTKRVAWDGEAGKCCWDCRTCAPGTVSSYVNSTRCVKCPVGSKPSLDQSICQQPYIDYLKWHEPFSLVMIFLLAFIICFLVYAVNIYVKKANTPVFLQSKSASLPLLLSLFVTFVLPVLFLMKPTQSACGAYNAIFMFSLGIPLTFLIARSHVVLNYCYGNDGDLKRKWFRCSPQTVISLALIISQLIIVVIVLSVAPAKVLTFTTPESDIEYIECGSHSRPEFLPLVFFVLALIMAFNILHMSEECTPLNQNEVKFVSFGVYLMYSIIFVYFVAVFGMNGKKKIRVLCAMAYLFGANFFATIFLPKIYVILFKPELNLPERSRLLKDENGNQAARLSKRECVESPLLGMQAGPYDRTEV